MTTVRATDDARLLDLDDPPHPRGHGAGGGTVIIGGGPAGLTAALCLSDAGARVVVLEATDTVGGISRTVERNGWRFDIGGHRFYTKVGDVEEVWDALLPAEDFPVRPRLSRIYYDGKFYDYPLNARNALRNLGPLQAMQCLGSYLWARVHPPRDQSNFEGWVQARFGRRLYATFFKTYTEKVWGMPASEIQADWAAQRIKNLSLGAAVRDALLPSKRGTITSLIEEFRYPRLGPGMMWEACRDRILANGSEVLLQMPVIALHHVAGAVREVSAVDADGVTHTYPCDAVISSMPIGELVTAMQPPPPAAVLHAAGKLRHRDFLTVALVVPEDAGFPDNWIYIHSPAVGVGRVQNFGAWSEGMVQPGRTCLGLEYFVHEGDDQWAKSDEELIAIGERELVELGLLRPGVVEQGHVVRMPKAYPVYDADYASSVDTLREWLAAHAGNVQPVGRNGMHRYNNQDHSMLTAMLAAENLHGAHHDLWSVNVDDEYHEEVASNTGGTGRLAPVPVG
jgi:protoporphyrinogen oxidase